MRKGLRVYGEVLRLVRRLPAEARPYYAKYARENFVNYRDLDDASTSDKEIFNRAYTHATWVLSKYAIDGKVGERLKEACFEDT